MVEDLVYIKLGQLREAAVDARVKSSKHMQHDLGKQPKENYGLMYFYIRTLIKKAHRLYFNII